jgi:hypothetical protein
MLGSSRLVDFAGRGGSFGGISTSAVVARIVMFGSKAGCAINSPPSKVQNF